MAVACLPSTRATQGSVLASTEHGTWNTEHCIQSSEDGVVVVSVCALAQSWSQQGPVPSKTEAGWPLKRVESRTLLPPAEGESVHQMLFLRVGSIHRRQAASTIPKGRSVCKSQHARAGAKKSLPEPIPFVTPVITSCYLYIAPTPGTKSKTTAPRIPAWSPTVVLTRRHTG